MRLWSTRRLTSFSSSCTYALFLALDRSADSLFFIIRTLRCSSSSWLTALLLESGGCSSLPPPPMLRERDGSGGRCGVGVLVALETEKRELKLLRLSCPGLPPASSLDIASVGGLEQRQGEVDEDEQRTRCGLS